MGHQHVRREPLPFVDHHVAAERLQQVAHLGQQTALHALFKPQGDHRIDIAQAVEQGGGDDMLLLIHLFLRLDERLVELEDHPDGEHAQGDADAAE